MKSWLTGWQIFWVVIIIALVTYEVYRYWRRK